MRALKNRNSALLITFISPLLGLYYSIKKLDWDQRKWVLIVFITVYGSVMPFLEADDAFRHQQNVYIHYIGIPFDEFLNELWHIITFRPLPGTNVDVYIHVLSYLTGGLLAFPQLFFVIVSFTFGYFYISSLSKIFMWSKGVEKPLIVSILIFLFVIYRSVDNIQTVRTWTGMWVLFDGIVGYFQTKKKKYLILILAAPIVHFVYLPLALVAFLPIITKKVPHRILLVIYFASFFVHMAPRTVIQQLNRTELGQSKVQSYYRKDLTDWEQKRKGVVVNWYVEYGKVKVLWWGTNALAFTLIIGGFFTRRMRDLEINLFTIGLMMAILANLINFIPAFYSRTMVNAGLYFLATCVLLGIRGELLCGSGFKSKITKRFMWMSVLIFIPKIAYTLANLLYFTSVYILALPSIGWVLGNRISLRQTIEWFF